MPARHTSLQDGLLLEADFERAALVDERGCRRDIRSNGWIVIRGACSFENRSGRRNRFSSFGADLEVRNFTGPPKARLRSGPDVFADALVPGTYSFPECLIPGTPWFPADIDSGRRASKSRSPRIPQALDQPRHRVGAFPALALHNCGVNSTTGSSAVSGTPRFHPSLTLRNPDQPPEPCHRAAPCTDPVAGGERGR